MLSGRCRKSRNHEFLRNLQKNVNDFTTVILNIHQQVGKSNRQKMKIKIFYIFTNLGDQIHTNLTNVGLKTIS